MTTQRGWNEYLKEGFEALERFQSEVVDAHFNEAQFGIQLELVHRVDSIELPPDGQVASDGTYKTWYSMGKTEKTGWTITNNGDNIWNADDNAGWVKSSKFGELIEACMSINAPIIQSGFPPSDKRAWLGLKGVWELKVKEMRGLEPTTVTLPIQAFATGQIQPAAAAPTPAPAPAQAAAPAAPAQAAAPPAPSAPPPVPAAVAYPDLDAHWGANADQWKAYVKNLVQSKSKADAGTALLSDSYCQADSVLTNSVNDESFWAWAAATDFVKEVDGVIV